MGKYGETARVPPSLLRSLHCLAAGESHTLPESQTGSSSRINPSWLIIGNKFNPKEKKRSRYLSSSGATLRAPVRPQASRPASFQTARPSVLFSGSDQGGVGASSLLALRARASRSPAWRQNHPRCDVRWRPSPADVGQIQSDCSRSRCAAETPWLDADKRRENLSEEASSGGRDRHSESQ